MLNDRRLQFLVFFSFRMMEETQVNVANESYDYDSFDEQIDERPTERWAPLGAVASSPGPYQTEETR
jgi:hypothetical protein